MTTTSGRSSSVVLSGPPPLGPGAAPLERLVAYGRARACFMVRHRDIARAALDGSQPDPAGPRAPMSQVHIRVLLGQLRLGRADLEMLTVQLAAALDGPVLLYLSSGELTDADDSSSGWGRPGRISWNAPAGGNAGHPPPSRRSAAFGAHLPGAARSPENELMAGAAAGYGRRVGIYMVMVRRARLRAVAPGVGLAPAR